MIWNLFLAQEAIFISIFILWTPQVYFAQLECALIFFKRKAPKQDSTKTNILGKLLLSINWPRNFRTCLNLVQNREKFDWRDLWTQLGLNEICLTMANWFHSVWPLCKYIPEYRTRLSAENFPIEKWQIPLIHTSPFCFSTDGAVTEHTTCHERNNNIHS